MPSVPTLVTANHMLMFGARYVCADSMITYRRGVARVPTPLQVFHIGLDTWTCISVHGMCLETLAWKPAHHAKRPYRRA